MSILKALFHSEIIIPCQANKDIGKNKDCKTQWGEWYCMLLVLTI